MTKLKKFLLTSMTRDLRLDFEGYLVMIKIMIKNFIEKELKKVFGWS